MTTFEIRFDAEGEPLLVRALFRPDEYGYRFEDTLWSRRWNKPLPEALKGVVEDARSSK